jgi:transposase
MTDLLSDQIGVLKGVNAYKTYPVKLRKVAFYDKEMNRTFIYLTNNMELHPEQIALLYKNRWQIELIFKWIKQHLKIKSFWETSENAVRIQIYSAIIAYCLIAVIEHDLQINRKTYEILQILGISLLNKTPIIELFTNIDTNDVKELNYNQLSINFI